MLSIKKIHNQVVKILSEASDLDEKLIETYLLKYSEDKKKYFVLFLNNLCEKENFEKTLSKITKGLEKYKDTIVDVDTTQNAIMFNYDIKDNVKEILSSILKKNEEFGSIENKTGETMVVEYSSPNIAKIFHVGHFRTTILGNFIKNLLNFNGYKTVSINYLGDWGKQFGLVLLGYKLFGSEEKLKKDSLMHLFHVYVEVNKHKELQQEARDIFRAMEEDRNEEYLAQWRNFREISIKKYKELYKKLNVEFDVYSGESFYNERGKVFANTCDLIEIDEDGSKVIDCGKDLGKALILKNDGATLYITRDIEALKERVEEYKPSKIIYVVSSEQSLHFKQLFKIGEMLGYNKDIFEHVEFGLVKGMSTREGTVHFIDDVIETAQSVFYDFVKDKPDVIDKEKTSLILAISFLVVNDFSAKRIKGYTFDIKKKATTQKGQALGPTIQYTHCRLLSILDVNKDVFDFTKENDFSKVDFSSLSEDADVKQLIYKLLWFESVNEAVLKDFEPSKYVLYLQDLCTSINLVINKCRVKGEDSEVAKSRLALFKCAQIVLRNAICVLGLTPLDKM